MLLHMHPGVAMPRQIEAERATVSSSGGAGVLGLPNARCRWRGSQGQPERPQAWRIRSFSARPEKRNSDPRPNGSRDAACDRIGRYQPGPPVLSRFHSRRRERLRARAEGAMKGRRRVAINCEPLICRQKRV
jgi:hypothetical protein